VTPQPLESQAPTGPSDAELLEAIAAGSQPAFEELRARYRPAIARLCRTIAGAESEDCEQEIFARIWSKATLFDRNRGSAAGWLLTVARHTALGTRTGRRPPTPVDADQDGDPVESAEIDRFWLLAALGRLPERERTVIELAYYRDLSESAIAKRLRVPLGSVKTWKRRGLNQLATLLGDEPT
jgi:RNA polymerase sigma-70 factor (ECF subfamily)